MNPGDCLNGVAIGLHKFALYVESRHRAVVTLVAGVLFGQFQQALPHLRGVRTMAALATVLGNAGVSGVRALTAAVAHVLNQIGWTGMRGSRPALRRVTTHAKLRGVVRLHQKFVGY